jgi:UDP-2-acetamido-3-amino-2,3-dideoxy-glucuronate N-acetyltransferase
LNKNNSIEESVKIGENVILGNNITIYSNVIIEDNVEIQDNSIIGKRRSITTNDDNKTIISSNTTIGVNTTIYAGTKIGENCLIADGASIRENCTIGNQSIIGRLTIIENNTIIKDKVKVQAQCHLTSDMLIENGVFIGPHVTTSNDWIPRSINRDGSLKSSKDWKLLKTIFQTGASIGANATIVPGINIGKFAFVGAGSVVTKDVSDNVLVIGVPAREINKICYCGRKVDEKSYCEYCKEIINVD